MKETKKIKASRLFSVVLLLAMLIVPSCKPKATHLTQNLENSRVPGQSSTRTSEEATQKPGQETVPVQPPTSVNDPTATSIEPLVTQGASLTLTPVEASASAPIVLTPTATTKSATTQAASSTPASTQTRTPTATSTKQPTGSTTLAPTQTLTSTPTSTKQPTGSATLAPTQTRTPTPTLTKQPTGSATQTRTSTSTLTATATPTKTATLTPTLQIGWEGEWVTYFERVDGSIGEGTLEFSLQGTEMTAVMRLDNLDYLFDGIVFNDGKYATGSWSGPDEQGNFWWDLLETGQFTGCHENHFAFCGSRPGLSQPSPCLELPSR